MYGLHQRRGQEPGEDDLLTRGVVEAKLAEARERLARYEGYRALMERDGLSQLSLTDAGRCCAFVAVMRCSCTPMA